jgi:hypothetical protein
LSLINPTPNIPDWDVAPRIQQISVQMDIMASSGHRVQVAWGKEAVLDHGDPWPDIMLPDGQDLPFVFQVVPTGHVDDVDEDGNPWPPLEEYDFTGSSVHVARIKKPQYPYMIDVDPVRP